MNKQQLLRRIQELCFAKTEAELFLDTHPECRDALDFYRRTVGALDAASEEYNNKYGPLTASAAAASSDGWSWVSAPWPWQMDEGNGNMPTAKREER